MFVERPGPGDPFRAKRSTPMFNYVDHGETWIGSDPMRIKMTRIVLALGTLAAALVSSAAGVRVG